MAKASPTLVDRFVREPLADLARPPRGQVPALDVLRAVAVLLVILVHTRGLYVEVLGQTTAVTSSALVKYGWSGVDLFFVLSGFLIGKQLWREVDGSKTVDVKRFVLRRGFRIWPLYFSFCFASLLIPGRAIFPFVRWWQDFTFTSNYFHEELVRGSWSLATEEQFYILTPLLLLFGSRRLGSLRAYRPYLYALLAVFPLLRAVTWLSLVGSFSHHDSALWVARIYLPFHLHADTLVMGLILSNLAASGEKDPAFGRSLWLLPVLAAVALPLVIVQREVFSFTVVALLFGSAARFAISPHARRVPLLGSRLFYVLSRLSFAMYLAHRYFESWVLDGVVGHAGITSTGLQFVVVYLGLVTVSALFALVTFCLIEHPFLAMRERVMDGPRRATNAEPIPPAAAGSESATSG
jgi:peptidoglycan/LPS O-acetylase OafA/YrhL